MKLSHVIELVVFIVLLAVTLALLVIAP